MAPSYDGQDKPRFAAAERLARDLGVQTVASARPLMHHGARRRLTDILTCIREGLRVEELGTAAQANAEQRLRSEAEMRRTNCA
jgi:DNA polymerase III alpha subunit